MQLSTLHRAGILALFSVLVFSIAGLLQRYSFEPLWAGITGIHRQIFIGSIGIATICLLFFLWYLLQSNRLTYEESQRLTLGTALLLLTETMWMPLTLYYVHDPSVFLAVIIHGILLAASLSAVYLTTVAKDKYVQMALAYIVMHTFFFDAVYWSYCMFLAKKP